MPLIRSIGTAFTPGLRMSSTIRLMPSCFGAWLSVRTKAYIQSDLSPYDVQILLPSTTK
ncbi:hypothetical protein D3C72_2571370 [compost metagenome]